MSVQPPSRGWNILGAVFLIAGGLLLIAIGGTCSYFIFPEILRIGGGGGGGMWPLLLLSLATLGAGGALIYQAVRLIRR